MTCSADNTVRLWDLGTLDENAAGEVQKHHSGRYVAKPVQIIGWMAG